MRSDESTARSPRTATQPAAPVPELTPEIVRVVLDELAQAYRYSTPKAHYLVSHRDAEGCALVAACVARGLYRRPIGELLAFFRAQAKALTSRLDLLAGNPVAVAQLDGIARAFEAGHIDPLNEEPREAALTRIHEIAGSSTARDVQLAALIADLAVQGKWLEAMPGDSTLEVAPEECARDFALELGADAPVFLDALRLFAAGNSDASPKYSANAAIKPANTNAGRARARS